MHEPALRSTNGPVRGARRAQAIALLSPAERARLDGEPHPERFLAGRMLLRELIADCTGTPLASIAVTAACPDCGGPHGRPRVELGGADAGVRVSLAHAGELTIAAATTRAAIGLDVEARDAAPERLAAISEVAGGEGLVHWTRVEAVLKADGRGLRVDPREVRIDGGEASLDGVRYRLIALGTELIGPDRVGSLAIAS